MNVSPALSGLTHIWIAFSTVLCCFVLNIGHNLQPALIDFSQTLVKDITQKSSFCWWHQRSHTKIKRSYTKVKEHLLWSCKIWVSKSLKSYWNQTWFMNKNGNLHVHGVIGLLKSNCKIGAIMFMKLKVLYQGQRSSEVKL